jgi:putative flippase GtrA
MDFAQNLLNKWFQLSDKIRFLFVGGLNAGISYIIYSISIIVLGENSYQISLALAWIISSVTSFTTQKLLVFNVKGNIIKQYLKCCTTWVFSYLINAFVLETLVKKAKCNVYLAQIIATVIAAIFTYIFFKKFAFKRKLAK